jgi:phosphoribosylaminoimidazolecarboxamide formyltransferase/IMP cyclohydrolase
MPTALFSVSDKTGLVDLASGLQAAGWSLLASGGTARALRGAGLDVQDVSDYTGSPEVLGGRVKTLHPAVHAGILARGTDRDTADLERIDAQEIDLVAVNLYPFREVVRDPNTDLLEAIENIDIGGVALIRAAAKNFARVAVLTDPSDYESVLTEIQRSAVVENETRHRLARKAFAHTAAYDAAISAYLRGQGASVAEHLDLELYPIQKLRYGENPHQQAVLYAYQPDAGPLGGRLLAGKQLSYNNLLDLDAAWRAALSFEKATICIIKHLSPCGIASAASLHEAYPHALASDPVSAFGSVIAANRVFDHETADLLGNLFVECIVAPGFTPQAIESLSTRSNLRLVEMPGLFLEPEYELRSVNAGLLRQSLDQGDPKDTVWRYVTQRQPDKTEAAALDFAWTVCQHVKSNAIVFASGEATVGIGGGQPNRVDCVRIAAQKAGERAIGAVMASDAFFPFPDSIEQAAKAGITAVIAPGGSVRDDQAIAAADLHGMAMVFTGVRHFRH